MFKLVLCGSMRNYEKMVAIKAELTTNGIIGILPTSEIENKTKKELSLEHFNNIACENTDGILVVNVPKDNINNYIGPNAFAEIAVATFLNKKVFILNGIYDFYKDELQGWDVICLYGNLKELVSWK